MEILSGGGENGENDEENDEENGRENDRENDDDATPLALADPLCVRFINTVGNHASDQPQEGLVSYDHLLRWGERWGALSADAAATLRREAAARPEAARAALAQAIALREALYRLFVAHIHGKPIARADLDTLNNALGCAPDGRRLTLSGGVIGWGEAEPRLATWPRSQAAWSAATALTSEEGERIGQCADDRGCGWLFLDTSRNRSRRWCSMGDCGNRAKQRRHTARYASARARNAQN